jgi:hypothetical protein
MGLRKRRFEEVRKDTSGIRIAYRMPLAVKLSLSCPATKN